ncbi:aspartate/glutamate racemase family protein [Paracoccus sp. CPCC 101403]|uniref:Aspartate/glutamate racemase family protein n=1 Tax=Paracoccus broussonetiae TaxID=3075834 RepID=A0ABU3EBR9_9RHOB|nr:aspartate/glutamate racemase family protein [Paracoccus sp. CPCC 101403]MDT1061680.1 aspartate/glutamate racemase family protein [Paracoccus sp. CPCC 101403]
MTLPRRFPLLLGAAMLAAISAGPVLAEPPVIVLINPNSNAEATKSMADLARGVAGDRAVIVERTNEGVPALLTTPQDMENAAKGVAAIGQQAAKEPGVAAVIVAAFSDPGLDALRESVTGIGLYGIGEAAFHEAARDGRPFSIVTVTPDPGLIESFRLRAEALGYGSQYRGVTVTPGDPKELVKDPTALDAALTDAVRQAVAEKQVSAIIMGGGPLSAPALRIQDKVGVPLVVAVSAATAAALSDLAAGK